MFAALMALGSPVAGASEHCEATQQKPAPATQAPQGKDKSDKGQPPQNGRPRTHWWSEPTRRAELGITDAQSAAIEAIWQKELPKLREVRIKLVKLEEELAVLTDSKTAEEAAVIAKIDAVENIRAEGNKLRTAMLYRWMKLLTPDQRARVKAMYEQPREPGKREPATSR